MKPEIWCYYRGSYKVYTEDYEAVKMISSWWGCRRSNIYYDVYGRVVGWDLVFLSKFYNKVARAVGLSPRKKNPNRVKHGKKLGSLAREKDYLRLQNKG